MTLLDGLAEQFEPARRILRDRSARIPVQKETAEGVFGGASPRSAAFSNNSLHGVLRHTSAEEE